MNPFQMMGIPWHMMMGMGRPMFMPPSAYMGGRGGMPSWGGNILQREAMMGGAPYQSTVPPWIGQQPFGMGPGPFGSDLPPMPMPGSFGGGY